MGAEATPALPERKRELVRRVHSHAELLPALRSGAQGAVFEGSSTHISFDRNEIRNNARYLLDALHDAKNETRNPISISAHAKLASIRAKFVKNLEALGHIDDFARKSMLNIYDAIINDLSKIAPHLASYEFGRLGILLHPNEGVLRWHQDNGTVLKIDHLRYVATLQGPSLELARDGDGTGAIVIGPNARSIMRTGREDGLFHRSPQQWPSDRITYTLWLMPKK